jgi:TPR repeat protein
MYNDGTGVEEDVDLALGFYKKACTGNNFGGCFNVGVLYEGGQGIDANAELAREFYRKACDGGYTRGCSKLEAKAAVPAPKPAAGGPPSVADYQPSWIGRTMVVRGTVSRFVQKNVNGEPYLYLYFKERPDSTVVACTRDDRWLLNVLGVDDFQSIVGKTLEFNLQVVDHPCTEQGASLWIWERHQARVVGGSAR